MNSKSHTGNRRRRSSRQPTKRGVTFRQHLLRALPVLLGGMLVMWVIESLGWLDHFNTAALDSILLTQEPRRLDSVVLVDITEEDFHNPALFGGRSPLDRPVLRALIDAVRAGGAHLIIVDIDTSESWDNGSWLHDAEGRPVDKCSPPILWAQAVRIPDRGQPDQNVADPLQPIPFADARHTIAPCEAALAIIPVESDGVVRRYSRWVEARNERGEIRKLETLAWAAFRMQSAGDVRSRSTNGDTLILNFAGDRYTFPRYSASQILGESRNAAGWRAAGPLTNRIVVVGGSFRVSRDVYRTPLGSRSGMELVAYSLASELYGGGIRPVDKLKELSLDLSVSLLLILLGFYASGRAMAIADIVLIPAAALLGSYLVFSAFAQWFSFVPYWVSVAVQQALERRHRRE